jgi:hypothetical protein
MVPKDPDPNSFSNITMVEHQTQYNTAKYLVMEIQYVINNLTIRHNKMKTSQKFYEDLGT